MYTNMEKGLPGLPADGSSFKRIESAAAVIDLDYGVPVFSYAGDENRVDGYNLDTATLVADADLVEDNSTVVTIDGEALDPVVWDTDHDTTMDAIVAEIVAAGYNAKLDATDANNRTILITEYGNNDLTVTAATTLGVGQAGWSATQSSQQFYRGISRFVQTENNGYKVGDAVACITNGTVWVTVSKAVESFTKAYFDTATKKFTDSASGTLDLGVEFKSSTSAEGIAVVELSGGKALATRIEY